MSIETSRDSHAHDPRTALVREKYFSLRPKPLERWLWQQQLPQAAERVFWVHWEEGMRGGDWCSQLSLKRVASLCCVDPSTVTRAYQVLKALDLIRRADPGRDPGNPFQQATPVTEVRLPRALLTELSRAPNRPSRLITSASTAPSGTLATSGLGSTERAAAATSDSDHSSPTNRLSNGPMAAEMAVKPTQSCGATQTAAQNAPAGPEQRPEKPPGHLKHRDYQRIMTKFTEAEKAAYSRAWADRHGRMTFEATTALSPDEQAHIQWQLHLIAQPAAGERVSAAAPHAAAGQGARSSGCAAAAPYTGPRRLAPLETARLRKRVIDGVPASEAAETFRQVLWAVEEGSLRRFEAAKAINIALKKIREGAWTRPNRMPPNWRAIASGREALRLGAPPETCSAA